MPNTNSFDNAVAKVSAARAQRDADHETARRDHASAMSVIEKAEQVLRQRRTDSDKVYYDRSDAINKRYEDTVREVSNYDD